MLTNLKNQAIKILIVEDEIIVAEDIKDILEEFGYIVIDIVNSGKKALTKLADTQPNLILMDIRIKGEIDGIQTAKLIWEKYQIPVVYLTANSDKNTLERAKQTAPFGYLTKPFKEKDLQTAIEIALHRHQLEKKLQEREQWLNTILNSLGDGVIATDEKNRITLLNPVAETLTGWQQTEAFGKNSPEVFHLVQEETNLKLDCPISQTLRSGTVMSIPEKTLLISKNGLEIPIDDSVAPIKDEQGKIKGAVVVFRDIIERKQNQKRLEAHHSITRLLSESNSIAEAIPQILQTLCQGLEWDLGVFWLLDRQQNLLRYVDNWHLPSLQVKQFETMAEQLAFACGVRFPGLVWESGQPVAMTNFLDEESFLPGLEAMQSALGLPVFGDKDFLGVMTFYSDKIQHPDAAAIAMLSAISSQIGQFIERKRSETALRESQQLLAWQAKHDPLTGLVNRREFERCLQEALNLAKSQDRQHILCYLDLDRFKIVNDSCGHGAGDELLRQVTALLRSQIRSSDLLARLGGDEFGLLLQNCPTHQALLITNSLRQSIEELRFICDGKTFTIGVSVGLVAVDATTPNLASAVNAADAACYIAKNTGRNRVHLYQASDREVQQHGQTQWVTKLTRALEEDLFRLYYQPIVPLSSKRDRYHTTEHYEVLLRLWDDTGIISPMAFIPAAERYHLMQHIDRWVIRTLFATQGEHYREQGKSCHRSGDCCTYSINLSGASIVDDQFVDFVLEALTRYRIPPQVICFEITETVAISNLGKARKLIEDLKNLGCRFALDDFGSGMSSFAYLRNLPVDYLKIDGTFIKDILEDPTDLALTEAINHIGHVMGLQTVAEFVENKTILEKLKAVGVDYAQGYGIGKPRPL
jgi:diguanylate cyclase (GGDEF)-like protein/PAS domain S-box-containing protein